MPVPADKSCFSAKHSTAVFKSDCSRSRSGTRDKIADSNVFPVAPCATCTTFSCEPDRAGPPHLYCGGHGKYADDRALLGRSGQQLAVPAEADRHHTASTSHHLVQNLQVQGIVQDDLLTGARTHKIVGSINQEQNLQRTPGTLTCPHRTRGAWESSLSCRVTQTHIRKSHLVKTTPTAHTPTPPA